MDTDTSASPSARDVNATTAFKEAVKEYIRVHDQLMDAGKVLKDVRKKKGELAEVILGFMRKNNIDECATSDNGRLVRRESKRVEALKQDHIMGELRTVLGESRAEEVLDSIVKKREVTMKDSLSRRKPAKSE